MIFFDMVDLTRCFVQISRMNLWNYVGIDINYDATDIMDAVLELIVSLVNILSYVTQYLCNCR
jgi:hypothetical protein